MAKRNSTKTATKEAQASSEPKILPLSGWAGVDFRNAAPDSLGSSWFDDGEMDTQTNLKPKNLMIQNNVITTSDLALETRPPRENFWAQPVTGTDASRRFTGVMKLVGEYIYASMVKTTNGGTQYLEEVRYKRIGESSTTQLCSWELTQAEYDNNDFHVSDIQLVNYNGDRTLVIIDDRYGEGFVRSEDTFTYAPIMYIKLTELGAPIGTVKKVKKILNPSSTASSGKTADTLNVVGSNTGIVTTDQTTEGIVSTLVVTFVYTNEFGSTISYDNPKIVYMLKSLEELDYNNYIIISGDIGSFHNDSKPTGVNVYFTVNDNAYPIYAGHVFLNSSQTQWSLRYYGSFQDTSEWILFDTTLPVNNTTEGCNCRYLRQIDGRIYFYGDRHFPERVYIGGNSGNELSCATGIGGAYIDIEPGIGTQVKAIHKFKTASGASIVTVLADNVNTGLTQRFNIVETSVSITSAISTKTYMSEQVSNVVGTCSYHGSGVFWDGMYYLDRYGLKLTTQQMEYTSQLMSRNVSDPIKPIFTDRVAKKLENAWVIFIDGVIYFSLSTEDVNDETNNIVFCYDVEAKAWYTYSIVNNYGAEINVISLVSLDYHDVASVNEDANHIYGSEGLGIVTPKNIWMIPTAGRDLGHAQLKKLNDDEELEWITNERINIFIETADVGASVPTQGWCYLRQVEFNFDWFIGDVDLIIEGEDIYGRPIKVSKHIHQDDVVYNFQEWVMVCHKLRVWKITIKNTDEDRANFRLVNIMNKIYAYNRKTGIVYGFDSVNTFRTQHGKQGYQHTNISCYNDLARYILP